MEYTTPSPYLTQEAAGAFLGLSPRTLERFRVQGCGPCFLKLGRRVLYARADLVVQWAEAQRRTSTSDPGPAAPPLGRPRA